MGRRFAVRRDPADPAEQDPGGLGPQMRKVVADPAGGHADQVAEVLGAGRMPEQLGGEVAQGGRGHRSEPQADGCARAYQLRAQCGAVAAAGDPAEQLGAVRCGGVAGLRLRSSQAAVLALRVVLVVVPGTAGECVDPLAPPPP
jgi:hypothetical protein